MRRFLGLLAAFVALIAAGFIIARAPPVTDPAAALAVPDADPDGAPSDDAAPVADAPKSPLTEADRQARRLKRYDKDASGSVSRAEYLVNRRKSFAKADTNRDGRLDFEEFAAASAKKFSGADRNADGQLSPSEFASTAPKRKPKAACVCPPPEAE